jgi:beta-xylosidase
LPQSHSSGQTRSIGEYSEVSKASGREVLKKFEDAQEAWFEGEFSYTEAQSYYYLLTAKLNQYRGEGYVG